MPQDWIWSSASAHLAGRDELLARVGPMLERVADWAAYPASDHGKGDRLLARHCRTGRLPGNEYFVSRLESLTGTVLVGKEAEGCG